MSKQVEETKKRRVFVILVPEGARGMGHISVSIEQEEGGFREYSQGAINPDDNAFRLLVCKSKARVAKTKYSKKSPIYRMLGKKKRFILPTRFPEKIEAGIEQYIQEDEPYNSLYNNCSDFVVRAINQTGEFNFRSWVLPKYTFYRMKKKVNTLK